MNELEKNHQLVYRNIGIAMGMTMGLMTFGYRQFLTTKRFEKLEVLKKLCQEPNSSQPPDFNLVSDLAFNGLIDSIKITICFENFAKGLLLSNGFVIHKLDRNIFPDLGKEQFTKPITVKQLSDIKNWELNSTIDLPVEWMKEQIKGIGKQTIGMKEILSPGYLMPLGLNNNIIELCNPYFQYRNNLHLYAGEAISFAKSDYKDFTKIIDFVNRDLVRIQNMIVDKLNKGEQYKLKPIIYS